MKNPTRCLAELLCAGTVLLSTWGCGGSSPKPAPPAIVSVDPTSGIVTTSVTVTGSQLGSTQGSSTVTVGGVAVTPTSWSSTMIVFAVPASLYPSTADIVVTVRGKTLNAGAFEVSLPRTVYVNLNDDTANAVAAFSLAGDGTPAALPGSPYTTGGLAAGFGGDATSVAVHRGTRRLFATNEATVAVFDIDPVTGALTAVAGSPFSTGGTGSFGVVVNDAGTRVFVANCETNTVGVLDVGSGGTLTPVAGSPFDATGADCTDTPQLLHGDGLLSVTDESGLLFVYGVASDTGVLTPAVGSPFTIGSNSWNSRRDPSGTWLYVPNASDQTLLVYAFDSTSGVPSAIDGSPFASGSNGTYINGLAFAPDGGRLYMGNYDLDEITGFSMASGAPTTLTGFPFEVTGTGAATSLAVTRDGKFLVATDENVHLLSVLTIGTDGTLAPVTGSPFAASVGSASGVAIGD